MEQKSLKKNATLNIIKTIMGIIFPIITFPYASRILLPEGIGKINFANSIISYFALIASLGINTYATREAATIRDNLIELKKLIKEIITINLISTLIAYILFFVSLFFVPKFYDYKILLLISSITIIFNTIGINWFYNAIEEYSYITIRSIIFQIITVIFLFVFVRTKEDLYLYAFMNVIASVGSNICNLIHLKHFVSLKGKCKLELKKHLKPIFVLFGMVAITSIYTILDSSMLGFLSDDTQVGYYSAATKINKMVLMVITSIGGVLFPRLSYYYKNNNKKDFDNLVIKGLSITLCLAIPSTIGLHFLSNSVTLLLSGKQFIPAIPIMKIMNPIILLISISNFIGIQFFLPIGKEKITIISVGLGAITNFILNCILIPKFQALGAGIATVCAESVVTLYQVIYSRKMIDYKTIFINCIQFIFAAFFMSIYLFFITKLVSSYILTIIISITGGAFIYFLILLLFNNSIIINILNTIINKIKRKI